MRIKRFLAISLCLLLLLTLFVGCSAKMEADDYFYSEAPAETIVAATYPVTITESGEAKPVGESALPISQKLIRTVQLDTETEDLSATVASVEERIGELEGYIENREVYNGSSYDSYRNRYARLTLRIPADRLDQFVVHMGEISNIVNNRESTEDVTLQYVATQSRITALETEEARLLELLAMAKDMSDLLQIEARLTDVRGELEEVTSQLRLYDNLVNYGTVHLYISEVREYTQVEEEPETVWQRISTGFVGSLKGLGNGILEIFIFLVVALPYLLVVGVAVILVIFLVRSRSRKKKKLPPENSADVD